MKRPRMRRTFLNAGDERNYLADVIKYFAATARLRGRVAAGYLRRLEASLKAEGPDDGSILLQEYWARLYDARGDVAGAIPHREREIELIELLFEIGGPVESMVAGYSVDHAFLAREMRILHGHYLARGERRKAAQLLRRINRVSEPVLRPPPCPDR